MSRGPAFGFGCLSPDPAVPPRSGRLADKSGVRCRIGLRIPASHSRYGHWLVPGPRRPCRGQGSGAAPEGPRVHQGIGQSWFGVASRSTPSTRPHRPRDERAVPDRLRTGRIFLASLPSPPRVFKTTPPHLPKGRRRPTRGPTSSVRPTSTRIIDKRGLRWTQPVSPKVPWRERPGARKRTRRPGSIRELVVARLNLPSSRLNSPWLTRGQGRRCPVPARRLKPRRGGLVRLGG